MRKIRVWLALGCTMVLIISCAAKAALEYSPPIAPIKFTIESNGEVSVTSEASIVTPIGKFTISGGAKMPILPEENETIVSVRHRQAESIFDSVYRIGTAQKLLVDIDGKASLQISYRQVFIDCSNGDVHQFTVTSAPRQDLTSNVTEPELQSLDLHNLSSVHSVRWDKATAVTFVNESSETVSVYWIDYHGSRVWYYRLSPGYSYLQQTYVTHPWVVVDSSGRDRGLYQPLETPAYVVVRD